MFPTAPNYRAAAEIKKQLTHLKIRDGGLMQKKVMAMVIQISDIYQEVPTVNQ